MPFCARAKSDFATFASFLGCFAGFKRIRSNTSSVLTINYGDTSIEVRIQERCQAQHGVTLQLPIERLCNSGEEINFQLRLRKRPARSKIFQIVVITKKSSTCVCQSRNALAVLDGMCCPSDQIPRSL